MASKPPEKKKEERGLIKMDEAVGTKGTLQVLLQKAESDIALVIPKYMTTDKIMKMALIAISREPKLLTCTQASILQAVINAAECGLDCSGKLGEGWLIPYWNSKLTMNEAQFIPGYQGYVKLMCQHESVIFVESRLVYEDDDFDINYGSPQPIRHNPELRPKGDQVVMGAYAIIHMVGGHQLCEWMNLSELHKIKKRALANKKQLQYSPWTTDEGAMFRKSVIRRIQKYAPKTPEIQATASIDDDLDNITRQISAAVAENLTLPAAADGDKNAGLVARLGEQSNGEAEPGNEDPPDMSDEEKAVRDTYESMCNDPEYMDIPECKRELLKLEGGNFSFHERIKMALDNIKDVKVKYEKAKKGVEF
jgi:recombination protein RecT